MSFMPTIAANRPGKRNAACGLTCISRPAVLPSATTCPCQDLIFDKLSANPIKKRLKYNISGMTNTAYVFEGHSSSSKKSRNWFASDDHDAFSLILRYVSAVTAPGGQSEGGDLENLDRRVCGIDDSRSDIDQPKIDVGVKARQLWSIRVEDI